MIASGSYSKTYPQHRSALLDTTGLTSPALLICTFPPRSKIALAGSPEQLLAVAGRSIALATDEERLDVFGTVAKGLARLAREGKLTKQAAVDRLMRAAEAYSLIKEHGTDAVQKKLSEAFAEADRQEPSRSMPERCDEADAHSPRLEVVRASDVQPEPVEWLWPGRIAFGKLTLIAGEPGIGKSQLTIAIAAACSKRRPWPNGEGVAPLANVLMFSAEDDPADTIRPRLDAADADVGRIFFASSVRTGAKGPLRGFDIGKDLAVLETKIKLLGVRVLIIDPLNAYIGAIKSHEAAHVRAVLTPLTDMASRLKVAIVGIMHLNKSGAASSALNRVVGSGAFTAIARSVHAVAREADTDRVLFVPAKSNLGSREVEGLAYRIAKRHLGNEIDSSAVVWEAGTVSISADEILASPENAETRSAQAEAIEFLKEVLTAGPVSREDVARLAKEAEVAEATLKRAKKTLGVVSFREGGLGGSGKWYWALEKKARPLSGSTGG